MEKQAPFTAAQAAGTSRPTLKDKMNKPLRFHLAFLSLLIMVFIVSVDATALAVALPVCFLHRTLQHEATRD